MKEYENGGIHNNTYQILSNALEAPIPQSKEMNNILRKMEEVLSDYPLENKRYLIEFKEKVYEFRAFSFIVGEELKKAFPDVKKNCHYYSSKYVFRFPETELATGFITINDKRLPHSVLLYKENGEEYIIDLTRNLFIKKGLYEEITNFELVTIIDKKTLEEDMKLLKDFSLTEFGFKLRPYLFFEEEVRNDLNKNSSILKKKFY